MTTLPARGMPAPDILAKLEEFRARDARWHEGRTSSLVYSAGDEVLDLLRKAYGLFISENGLNPTVFPNLKRF